MPEFEDAILPDDFQEAQPEVEETQEETVSEEVETLETEQAEETTEQTEQQKEEQRQAFLKLKYNKEEMEVDENTARELAQKGLNYDKLQEKLQSFENDPRLTFVQELAKEQGMEVNDYLEAVRESREQQKLDELMEQNIPEEYAREILENKKFRQQMEEERAAKQEHEKQQKESEEFFDYFREANGRAYDPKGNDIPEEVWAIKEQQGVPLKIAYMQHHNKILQNQIKVLKQNEENAKRAPIGGLSTHGSTEVASEDDFLQGFNSI